MTEGFMWRLEEGHRFKTIILWDKTIVMIYGKRSDRYIEVHNYPTPDDALAEGLRETEMSEKAGLELYRVYSCPGSGRLIDLVRDARVAYIRNTKEVGQIVDSISGHIVGNSTILFPTIRGSS